MRNLASIQTIKNIRPIPGADAIMVGDVLGWHVVIKKDEFTDGQKGVYFEVDSVLPERVEFEFLRSRKFRIKTIELRKQVSQGLFMPMSILPMREQASKVGTDVTEILGVIKYDPEINDPIEQTEKSFIDKLFMRFSWYRNLKNALFPKAGGFPSWIKKTDETRIQSIPKVFDALVGAGTTIVFTEKVDGQSSTFFLEKKSFGFEFGVCSRNNRLPVPDGSNWWKVAKEFAMEQKLKELWQVTGAKKTLVLQGEIIGTGIQGNKYKINGLDFLAYNLIADGKSCNPIDVQRFMKVVGLESVPVVATAPIYCTMDELIEFSNGKSVLAQTAREGIVGRDIWGEISFKVISPKFLLKNDL